MSRPADRLRNENTRCKQDLRKQLLDIVKHLEDPSVQLLDCYGSVENGLTALPHSGPDTFHREGLDGKREYTLTIRTYNPHKNALLHLDPLEETP